MFLYSLYGHEDNYILLSTKEYTKEEFERMCLEVKPRTVSGLKHYDYYKIKRHLIVKYGFKEANYVAKFFFDADIK